MTAPSPSSSTNELTSGPSTTPLPTGNPDPWKAGAHSRFAGRSAEEILGIAEAAASMLERFNQQPPQPAASPPNRFDFDIKDDEYVDGRQFKQIVAGLMNQPAPQDPVARQAAAGALFAALQMQYADEFKRWGAEIRQEASKLPIDYWNLDNLTQIVKIVRSNHVDELAAEKAQRIVDESHPTIRSGTGGAGSGPQTPQLTLAGDGIPQDWVEKLRARGIDEAKVREFCDATGQTPAQYYADVLKYGKGAIIGG